MINKWKIYFFITQNKNKNKKVVFKLGSASRGTTDKLRKEEQEKTKQRREFSCKQWLLQHTPQQLRSFSPYKSPFRVAFPFSKDDSFLPLLGPLRLIGFPFLRPRRCGFGDASRARFALASDLPGAAGGEAYPRVQPPPEREFRPRRSSSWLPRGRRRETRGEAVQPAGIVFWGSVRGWALPPRWLLRSPAFPCRKVRFCFLPPLPSGFLLFVSGPDWFLIRSWVGLMCWVKAWFFFFTNFLRFGALHFTVFRFSLISDMVMS